MGVPTREGRLEPARIGTPPCPGTLYTLPVYTTLYTPGYTTDQPCTGYMTGRAGTAAPGPSAGREQSPGLKGPKEPGPRAFLAPMVPEVSAADDLLQEDRPVLMTQNR